jgi:hypothetical protein
MDTVIQAWLQLGVAGVLTLSTVAFVHYLLTKTLPGIQAHFREDLAAERNLALQLAALERQQRTAENTAFLAALDSLRAAVMDGQAKILDRADFGAKELIGELGELRASVEARFPPQHPRK